MTATLYTEMIDRAKSAADMHDGFPSITTWLYFLNAEFNKLWVKLIRSGYPPSVTYTSITATGAASYSITEPSAVIAVYGISTSAPATQYYNIPVKRGWEQTFLRTSTYPKECYISSDITAGTLVVKFSPSPSSGTFYVVNVPKPPKIVSTTPASGQSNSVNLPFGWEERIVLGMAQRALAKEETINPAIENELQAVDEQIDTHVMDYILQQSNTAHASGDFPDSRSVNYLSWFYV